MNTPINPDPQPIREGGIETLVWPLRLSSATIYIDGVNEDGEAVRVTANLRLATPGAISIVEIGPIDETWLPTGPSTFYLQVHGAIVPNESGAVYTVTQTG